MTREEAIAILQEEMDGNLELTLIEWRERDEQKLFPAIRMAIKALQADAVSREWYDDAVKANHELAFTDLPDIPRYYYEKVVGKMAHEINVLKEQLESADAEWIPCSERLPEVGEICLLTVREYGWNCKDYTRVIIGEYSDNYADHILAWMPLPKPYKGGDSE